MRTVLTIRATDRVTICVQDAPADTLPLLSGRDWWTDDTTPRTDRPVRFSLFAGKDGVYTSLMGARKRPA